MEAWLEDGATVEEMLRAIGVPDDETVRGEITIGLKGELGQRDTVLNEADERRDRRADGGDAGRTGDRAGAEYGLTIGVWPCRSTRGRGWGRRTAAAATSL